MRGPDARAVWMPSCNQELHLMAGKRHLATVWHNGTWHTWDRQGIGGENSQEKTIEEAQTQAELALVRQGWMPRTWKAKSCK